MEREKCKEVVINFYEEITRYLSGNFNYELTLSSNDDAMLEKWLSYIDKTCGLNSIGEMFLLNWVECSFDYWLSCVKTKDHIYFNWIFGKKASDRYEKIKGKDKGYNHFRFRELRKNHLISLNPMTGGKKSGKAFEERVKKLSITEERYRRVFLNKDEGLVYCGMNTTLYNHLSESCMLCVNQQNCKNNLLLNYPHIFKLRGYK